MKNARAELVDIGDGIDELADQMAGIPFQSKVLVFGLAEEPLPDGGLAEHVVVHDRQMIRPLRTLLESDSNSAVHSGLREWLPESAELRQIILERFVNWIAATLKEFRFNH